MLGCKSQKELAYKIYVDEASSESFTKVEFDEIDSSFIDVESLPDYIGKDEISILMVPKRDTLFSEIDNVNWQVEVDKVELMDSVQENSLIEKSTSNLIADSAYVEKDSLDLLSMDWARPINNDVILELDSNILIQNEDSTFINQDSTSPLMAPISIISNQEKKVSDTLFVDEKNIQPLYIIDKNLDQPGMAYVVVDTIAPLPNLESGRKVIVIRKFNLNLENNIVNKHGRDSIIAPIEIIEVNSSVKNQKVSFNFTYGIGELMPVNSADLSQVIDLINTNKDKTVMISSRTDAVGSNKVNLKISELRALKIKDFLVEKGVNEQLIFIQYLGEKYASPEGNESDRVTIVTLN